MRNKNHQRENTQTTNTASLPVRSRKFLSMPSTQIATERMSKFRKSAKKIIEIQITVSKSTCEPVRSRGGIVFEENKNMSATSSFWSFFFGEKSGSSDLHAGVAIFGN